MNDFKKMAVLIDADNTQLSKLEEMLNEVSTYGRIVVKKAYGNWRKTALGKWEDEIKRLAIKAEQQFDYVAGKNTTDIAMVIDAMDMLHTGMYDAVVLVSSDSDFTPLAVRLRESGMYIIGVGEKKTPVAFCNACDNFIYLEYLASAKQQKKAKAKKKEEAKDNDIDIASDETHANDNDIDEIHSLLHIAYEKYQDDDDDYVNVAAAGDYIKRVKPDFNTYAYGFTKLSTLIKSFPKKYELKKLNENGKPPVLAYRCIDKA